MVFNFLKDKASRRQPPSNAARSEPNPSAAEPSPVPSRPSPFPNTPPLLQSQRRPDPPKPPGHGKGLRDCAYGIELFENPAYVKAGPSLVPKSVKCDLILVYNRKELRDLEGLRLHWLEPGQFKNFDGAAQQCLRDHGVPESAQLYRKVGRCRLVRHPDGREMSSEILETQEHWSEALPLQLTTFIASYPYIDFHVEIRWEYSALTINRIEGQKYAFAVRKAIESKLKPNWQKKDFITDQDLDEIFTEGTISELIRCDKSLDKLASTSPPDTQNFRHAFSERVALDATRLLALCIWVELPLVCLFRMLENGLTDTSLPLNQCQCPLEDCSINFRHLLNEQGGFIAHKFVNDRERPIHRKLSDEVVVPIMFDKKVDMIGEGGFGTVYKVTIDVAHHTFAPDRDRPFALKIFKELGSRTQRDFDNEKKVLDLMSELPHKHITLHLASWTQDNRFYMLFPRAETNLGVFLRQQPQPTLSNEFMNWLLEQMKGIAEAVRHIHNIGPSGLGPDSVAQNLLPLAKRGRTGFHHDLKPENILAFLVDGAEEGSSNVTDYRLKISDFGTARIDTVLSRSGIDHSSLKVSSLSHGDAAYGAPDYALDGRTSRPYDLWSLGCIFLEVLVWAVGPIGRNLNVFKFERLTTSNPEEHQSEAFWHRSSNGNIKHKPAVIAHLKQLKTTCKDKGVFDHLLRATTQMLKIHPLDRMDAKDLCNVLDTQILQLQVDLVTPNYYAGDMKHHREVAAPPTILEDKSERSSIDEHPHIPQDVHLRPKTGSGSRPRSPSTHRSSDPVSPDQPIAQATPPRGRVFPVATQNLPSPPLHHHQRSPSIAISNHDDPLSSPVVQDDLDFLDLEPAGSVPTAWPSSRDNVGLEHIERPTRSRSRSTDSRRSSSAPV